MLSILIPAFDEAKVLGACLASLAQQTDSTPFEVLVIANGCTDNTAQVARTFADRFRALGSELKVLEMDQGNKSLALNAGDQAARYPARLYLDADVTCGPGLLAELSTFLHWDEPLYLSGSLQIQAGSSRVSRSYARIWQQTPYIRDTIPGCGCYAVNAAGRRLWGSFPPIHSDDKFVRLLFHRGQKKRLRAQYFWPLPQGLMPLIRVRIRWTRGNRQLARIFPRLLVNDSKRIRLDVPFVKNILRHPVSTAMFLSVYGAATLRVYTTAVHKRASWSRAR